MDVALPPTTLLVDPAHGDGVPVDQLLWLEPQGDLLLSRLNGVRPMDDVAANLILKEWLKDSLNNARGLSYLDAEVTPDGAGFGVLGVGLSEHDAAGLDHVESLPDHGQDGARCHVLDESGEEGAGRQVGVVVLQVLLRGLKYSKALAPDVFSHFRILIRYLHELHGDELESLLFEPLDDVTDEAAVDAVGLDHDEGPLGVGHDEGGWLGLGA